MESIMSKYDPLHYFLKMQKNNVIFLKFTEIERILGFGLPASAFKYPAWWANQSVERANGNHSNAVAWISAGWETTELDLMRRQVKFIRI
jgi:hypothetical protein